MKKVKLGDILEVKRGTTLAGKYYSTCGEKIRLTLGNFNYPGGGFKTNTSKTNIFFNGPVNRKFILNKGDIITPLTEQVSGLLGETARIPESGKYIQSGDIALIVPIKGKLDSSFAYYLISSLSVKKQLGAAAQQTKIRHTTPDKIKQCEVWIPELYKQKKIGKILDLLDSKITNNEAIAQQLELMIKTIYDYWFLQFEFPNLEGKPYKSSGGKMVWNEELKLEIPVEWDSAKLKDIIIENPKSKVKVSDVINDGEIPFFTSGADILETSKSMVSGMNCYLNTGGVADVKYYYGEASYSTDTWCITAKGDMKYILPFVLDKIKPSMDKVFFKGLA